MQAGGQRFESVILHFCGHPESPESPVLPERVPHTFFDMLGKRKAGIANLISIVNDDFTRTAESIQDDDSVDELTS